MALRTTALLLLLVPTLLLGQRVHGPRLGMSLATQSVQGLFKNTSNLLPGVVLGYGAEFDLHPQFAIMPELLWLTKGAVVRNQPQLTRSRSTFHYLELPVLVKIGTDSKPGGLFLNIGPSLGYYISGRYKQWFDGDLIQDRKFELTDTDNRFEFSMAMGMGTDMERTSFEFRAQSSITPFSSTLQTLNIVYQLTFAWRFHPKPKEERPAR